MVWAQALREEHPDRDGRRVDPSLPKPSCPAEGLVDMIISQQAREVELSLSTRLGYCLPKRNIHLRPPCLVGFLIPPLQAQGRPFLSIAPYRLKSYKSSSAIRL